MKPTVVALLLLLTAAVAFAAQPAIVNTATVTANNAFTGNGDGTVSVTTQVANTIPTLSVVGLTGLVAVSRRPRHLPRAAADQAVQPSRGPKPT